MIMRVRNIKNRSVSIVLACVLPVAYLAGRLTPRPLAGAVATADPDHARQARLSPVSFAQHAVVTTTSGSEVGIPLLLENTTLQPLRYAVRRGGGAPGVFGVNVAPFRDGKPAGNLGRSVSTEGYAPLAEDVRELAPGHGVVHTLRPWRDFPDFDPGRYELRVTYAVPPGSVYDTELKLTVMSVTRSITLVVEPKK